MVKLRFNASKKPELKIKKMSDKFLNNRDIVMKEPNASNYRKDIIVTMVEKEMAFNLNPNIQNQLASYFNQNNLFSSELRDQEQVIKEIIKEVSKLSDNLNILINHCKEKYEDINKTISNFAETSNDQINKINNDILFWINVNEIKNEQDIRIKTDEDKINQTQDSINKIVNVLKYNETLKKSWKYWKNFRRKGYKNWN